MKAIEKLRKELEAIGATLDDSSDYSLHCDAPRGYVWRANQTPTLSIQYASNHQSWLMEALRYEYNNLKMGLILATAEELVEIRHLNDDDSWGAMENAPERIEFKVLTSNQI